MLGHKSLFVTVLSFSRCGMHELSIYQSCTYMLCVCVCVASYKRVLERGGAWM